MTLFFNNDDVAQVLTMKDTIAALEVAYSQMARQEAVCRRHASVGNRVFEKLDQIR